MLRATAFLAALSAAVPAVAQEARSDPSSPAIQAIFLTDVTLTQTAVVAIALGPRTLTVSTNCLVGDRLFMTPGQVMPAGYQLGDIYCSSNGTAQATLYAPVLAIGASYSILVKVVAFR